MENRVEQRVAIHVLLRLMDRRGLAFDDRSDRSLMRYTTEKLIDLAQILVMEGRYAFFGECEVSGLKAHADDQRRS